MDYIFTLLLIGRKTKKRGRRVISCLTSQDIIPPFAGGPPLGGSLSTFIFPVWEKRGEKRNSLYGEKEIKDSIQLEPFHS